MRSITRLFCLLAVIGVTACAAPQPLLLWGDPIPLLNAEGLEEAES